MYMRMDGVSDMPHLAGSWCVKLRFGHAIAAFAHVIGVTVDMGRRVKM